MKKVIKSFSPINRRLQPREKTTFEQKNTSIYSSRISLFESIKNHIFAFEQAALLSVLSLSRRLILFKFIPLVKEIEVVQKAQRL